METLWETLSDASYVLLALVMLLVAKISLDLLTPFKVDDQTHGKDNPAFGISLVGYYLGVLIVFMGSISSDAVADASLWKDLLAVVGWTALGIVLLNISRLVLDRVVFRRFSTRKEVIDDRNVGMGAVEFGTFVGSSLVVAGAISGNGGGIDTALAFYALGQAALMLYAAIYQRITQYDFHRELEQDNVAAGTAYAGNIIAMGALMLRGTAGDFISWSDNLWNFAWYLGAAFILLLAGRWAIDLVLLPGRTLHEEISEDRNLNAGLLEGGVLLGLAGVIFLAL